MAELCHFPAELVMRTRELQNIVKVKFLPSLRFRRSNQENVLLVTNSLLQSLLLLTDSTLDDAGYKTYLNSIKESISTEDKVAILRLLQDCDSEATNNLTTANFPRNCACGEELKSGDNFDEMNRMVPSAGDATSSNILEQDFFCLDDLLPLEQPLFSIKTYATTSNEVNFDGSPEYDLEPLRYVPQKRDIGDNCSSFTKKHSSD